MTSIPNLGESLKRYEALCWAAAILCQATNKLIHSDMGVPTPRLKPYVEQQFILRPQLTPSGMLKLVTFRDTLYKGLVVCRDKRLVCVWIRVVDTCLQYVMHEVTI